MLTQSIEDLLILTPLYYILWITGFFEGYVCQMSSYFLLFLKKRPYIDFFDKVNLFLESKARMLLCGLIIWHFNRYYLTYRYHNYFGPNYLLLHSRMISIKTEYFCFNNREITFKEIFHKPAKWCKWLRPVETSDLYIFCRHALT